MTLPVERSGEPTVDLPVVAEVVRSGVVEGHHRGSVVVLAADGSVAGSVGVVDRPILPRSSNKPLQAAGMLAAGLDLDGELLALAAASHSGEPFHLDGVRRILAGAGVTVAALRTPAELPLGEAARTAWLAAGRGPEPVAMNCSGKHAAMLATCVAAGWPTEGYRDATHPLQQALRATVARLSGEAAEPVAVDGCGAPILALSLVGLARSFRACVLAPSGSPERRVADAVRAHPLWMGGPGQHVSELVAGVPGLLAKDGAEGVYAAALPDGRAVALKIDDGAERARSVVMAAALHRLGVRAAVVEAQLTRPVLGGGHPVGSVRAVELTM